MGWWCAWGRSRRCDGTRVDRRCDSLRCLFFAVLAVWCAPAAAHDVEEEPEAPLVWEFDLAAGGTLRSGDENRYAGNADVRARRFWSADTVTFRALGFYGKTGGEVDTNNAGAFLDWRHALGDRFFWLSQSSAETDPVQDRNLRVTVSTGPGYRMWEQSETEFFDIASGLGYRYETFRGDEGDNNLLDARAGYVYQDKLGEALDVIHFSDVYAPVYDIENFLFRSELTLSVPLFGGIHWRNNVRYEYVNEPAEGRKNSNVWLTFGVQYHFESRLARLD
jgi:putative salt-induced outer membrane protein YdiY